MLVLYLLIFSTIYIIPLAQLFRLIPSLRFEYFLVLLKHAEFIIGNSSAGIREAPAYAIYTINIGTRQDNRFAHESIINTPYNTEAILESINKIRKLSRPTQSKYFGNGKSAERFLQVLEDEKTWNISTQKVFYDLE